LRKVWIDTKRVLSLYCQKNDTKRIFKQTKNNLWNMQNSLTYDAAQFADIVANELSQIKRVKLCAAKRSELIKRLGTLAGVRRYLTEYRAAVNAHPQISKKAALLRSLRISKAANKKIQTVYETKIILRTEKANYSIISADIVPPLIEKATALLSSGTRYKVAAGLLFLTGRRTAEIFLTGGFSAVKNEAQAVKFSGQLKKRKSATVVSEAPYKIPILCEAAKILEANNWLKSQYNGNAAPKTSKVPTPIFTDIADVNKRVSRDLGQTVKAEFAALLGTDVAPHDLRKAYAAICYYLFPKKESTSFRSYAKKILGHTDGKTGLTSEAYNKYKVL